MGEMPGGLLQRDSGYPDALLSGNRGQRRPGAPAQTWMVEHGPQPRLRVEHVFHVESRNQASGDAIGDSMSPRTSAVPAREPTSPPAPSVLGCMRSILATSQDRAT